MFFGVKASITSLEEANINAMKWASYPSRTVSASDEEEEYFQE